MPDKKSSSNVLERKRISINKDSTLHFISNNYIFVVLVVLLIAGSLVSNKFMTQRNMVNVLLEYSMYAILAIGELFVIITGGIDLSIGSVVAVAVCFVAGFIQGGMGINAIILVLVLTTISGLVSGLLVTYVKIAPFIATLAMMTILRGIAYIYQVGSDRRIDGSYLVNFVNSSVGPIPVPAIIMVAVLVIAWFILSKTTFGRSLYAIGGNSETARMAGINVKLNTTVAYGISGLLSGLGGVILAGRIAMGTALVGTGYELDAIAAVVIGGAVLSGGKGTALKTLVGAFILGLLYDSMNLMGIADYPQMIVKGIIILLAVFLGRE